MFDWPRPCQGAPEEKLVKIINPDGVEVIMTSTQAQVLEDNLVPLGDGTWAAITQVEEVGAIEIQSPKAATLEASPGTPLGFGTTPPYGGSPAKSELGSPKTPKSPKSPSSFLKWTERLRVTNKKTKATTGQKRRQTWNDRFKAEVIEDVLKLKKAPLMKDLYLHVSIVHGLSPF